MAWRDSVCAATVVVASHAAGFEKQYCIVYVHNVLSTSIKDTDAYIWIYKIDR
jgi:hypothetical protein